MPPCPSDPILGKTGQVPLYVLSWLLGLFIGCVTVCRWYLYVQLFVCSASSNRLSPPPLCSLWHLGALVQLVVRGAQTDAQYICRDEGPHWINEETFTDHLPGISHVLSGTLRIPKVQSPAPVKEWSGENWRMWPNVWYKTGSQSCTEEGIYAGIELSSR